jgi:uncharacterized protein (TIGR00255 family)
MTGFGKAEGIFANKKIVMQLKSLNSKQSDINVKMPTLFREKELAYRKIISDSLTRGKIELALSYENLQNGSTFQIDGELLKNYYNQLKVISSELGADESSLIEVVSKFPDVLKNQSEDIAKDDWHAMEAILLESIKDIKNFRAHEGLSLEADLRSHVNNISNLLQEALKYEHERVETVRERLKINLEDLEQKVTINEERFEQELIYYIEKYDISEEKVRLNAHCEYFIETMNGDAGQGKKLGFISQEMGREINTLGSKANHAEMQKIVVQMKDELEKIKEQVLNVL